ncbi:MAG: tryptophan synthase subunit alpha [Treponema sp.]|jgi:tryptophan synthase alpha chain|nr:tryptophan synthase subunit alpha [Treponema sp.]
MSNIGRAFKSKKAFIGFVTGGDPAIEKSEEFILEMIRAGADLVEIGVPFSDPIAEGPVIQAANLRALASGTTIEKLFRLVERLRKKTQVPLVFLTYLNPVFRYGSGRSYDPFFARAAAAGLDGIIIPDLPFEEQGELRPAAAAHGIDLISLIAPTSQERIQDIARAAAGFVYLVSSLGVTGVRSEITTDLASMVAAVKSAADIPAAVGFGIHSPAQAADIARVADGVIVGSAIVKIVAEHGEAAGPPIYRYVREMTEAIRGA